MEQIDYFLTDIFCIFKLIAFIVELLITFLMFCFITCFSFTADLRYSNE